MKEFMSGDELYRFLHISKRKMKYLLENGYIPMTDMGRKTHRYKIRLEDAKAFRRRMKQEPGFLSELTGMFNTRRTKKEPRPAPTEKDIEACRRYWAEMLADQPEALRIPEAAVLTGYTPQRISALCARGEVWSTVVQGKRFCSKESLIQYMAAQSEVPSA